jgi:hypothetical protein
MPSELPPPLAQGRLADVEPYTPFADRLEDEVHMRMRFIGMKRECVAMFQCELISRKVAASL